MESVATVWKALTPSELLERYGNGERDFAGVNLLRAEIEYILQARPSRIEFPALPTVPISLGDEEEVGSDPYYDWDPGPPVWFHRNFDVWVNPVWADYRSYDPEFQWFGSERFYDEEYEDIPTKLLSGCDLQEIDLTGAYLYPVDLSNAILTRAILKKTKLIDADLHSADMRYIDLRRAMLIDCDLRDADLHMARLDRAAFINCNMEGANLERAKLRKTVIASCNLRGVNLRYTQFSEAILNGSHLEGVELKDVKLPSCRVHGVSINESQVPDFLRALEVRINALQ